MDFHEWEPIYEQILADFGYDRAADETARDFANTHLIEHTKLPLSFRGDSVAIVSGAHLTGAELSTLDQYDRLLAVGTAIERLEATNHSIALVVTDLDSAPSRVSTRTNDGGMAAVHAHGDNRDELATWLPKMDPTAVIGTTQAAPCGAMLNVGGFTDGDRAAFLADHFEAASLSFVGWDLADQTVDPIKRKKLNWAAQLLHLLESRRGEHYSVLDPVRHIID